jgi:hypothetical protein
MTGGAAAGLTTAKPKPGFNERTNQLADYTRRFTRTQIRMQKNWAILIVKDHRCCSFCWKKRQP